MAIAIISGLLAVGRLGREIDDAVAIFFNWSVFGLLLLLIS